MVIGFLGNKLKPSFATRTFFWRGSAKRTWTGADVEIGDRACHMLNLSRQATKLQRMQIIRSVTPPCTTIIDWERQSPKMGKATHFMCCQWNCKRSQEGLILGIMNIKKQLTNRWHTKRNSSCSYTLYYFARNYSKNPILGRHPPSLYTLRKPEIPPLWTKEHCIRRILAKLLPTQLL